VAHPPHRLSATITTFPGGLGGGKTQYWYRPVGGQWVQASFPGGSTFRDGDMLEVEYSAIHNEV
jgi:hypothetical protein